MKFTVLFNSLSGNGRGKEFSQELLKIYPNDELEFVDVISLKSYKEFFMGYNEDDNVIICGGDGTLNKLINSIDDDTIKCKLLYFATGTGNDFLTDIGGVKGEKPILINDYIKNLPIVKVNGKELKFLNNVGFGIDGYCTQIGDEMRAAGKTDINYAGIAIKGILGKFHPINAEVVVDGEKKTFKKTWLAPTMFGRYYGGGMMAAPKQDRKNAKKTCSVMLYYGSGKLKSLIVFPSIFKGEHVNHKEMVEVIEGNHIKVTFDRPTPLQVDGETILNMTTYEVISE